MRNPIRRKDQQSRGDLAGQSSPAREDVQFLPNDGPGPGNVHRSGAIAIRVEHVHKSYLNRATGASVAALDDVNLEIGYGEFVSVVGASGCGKSTLLRIIAGLIAPTAGNVEVEGRAVTEPVSGIAFVFQKPVLLPWKTALENVMLPATLGKKRRDRSTERGRELLELVGLASSEMRYPHELSGGMQQRVALARALFVDSRIVLMDEPFGAVDALTRDRLNVDVSEIMSRANRTSVMVTHSIGEAVFLADRVFVMSSGPGRIAGMKEVHVPQPRLLASMTDMNVVETIRDVRETLMNAG